MSFFSLPTSIYEYVQGRCFRYENYWYRAQLLRRSPTFIQVYFLVDFWEVYLEFKLLLFLFLRRKAKLVFCRH